MIQRRPGLEPEEAAGLSDQNGEGNQAREGGAAECPCTGSFGLRVSGTQRKGGSGAKGHLVKEHHDPQSC